MIKRIFLIIISLVGITVLYACSAQAPEEHTVVMEYSAQMPEKNTISPYLPITRYDSFELTTRWLWHNYPYGKTDFTDSEFMILHNAISNLVYYGPTHPYQDEGLYGIPPFLIAKGDNHETRVYFIIHSEWGTLATAIIDDEQMLWFTMDSDAYHEVVGLIGWGYWEY